MFRKSFLNTNYKTAATPLAAVFLCNNPYGSYKKRCLSYKKVKVFGGYAKNMYICRRLEFIYLFHHH